MNEKQLEAVKSLDNTLVIAGPGSGKTFTIINKVDYLIKNKIYKENEILLISFTNESVNDLKKKLNYNIDILTFHKLAMKIMQNKQNKQEPFMQYEQYYCNYMCCQDIKINKISFKLLCKSNKENICANCTKNNKHLFCEMCRSY